MGAPPPAAPPEPGPRRRRVLPIALAAALVLVLALVGVAVVRPGPVADWLGDEPADRKTAQAAEPAPVAVLAGADPNAPRPTPEGVRAALEPLLGQEILGSRVNISVVDVDTGDPLYTRGGDDPTVPASVTKLVTAVTVLAARGPTYRIPTRAVAGASPGEVVIVGGGDPTLAVDKQGFYPGAARLDDLAAQVRKALGGTKPTKVTVDGSLYSGPVHEPGWDPDIPTGGYGSAITALMTDAARTDVPRAKRDDANGNHAAQRAREPDLAAGRSFARLLGVPTDAVKRGKAPAAADATGGAPGPGAELGKVESLPLNRMVDVMISDSDNIVAEALARQVALARNQPASFEGGAAAMDAVVAELGLPADEIDLADASGLSRDNRISPSLLTDLIVLAGNGSRPELAVMFGGLPVAGWSGTLADRYDTAAKAGAGVVRAKTGTLTGVHALAGVVTTADGRLLSFAVLTDRVPPVDSDLPRRALDRVVAALAACGCR
ncbi:D-alanyl-D-alanine carboxypeptidase/D-alanyl-D-alanine endopeptidase [Micromonospora citrea]|uniref:D-alanyl-D-alanine carboxypeptidase/D-alanyl-D-alanine endopeptidase n=1 Tax=Micromonospora citrea TaxID=47855 RepID=UPI001FE1EA17|nr:D-alanyl-D-alanine carboxypeptidase/D-alanyl-D-alanine-endopeptidase [Micromonospora citrea]